MMNHDESTKISKKENIMHNIYFTDNNDPYVFK